MAMPAAPDLPEKFGFKRLSRDNWLTPDPIWDAFASPAPPLTRADSWVKDVLAVSLDPHVPTAIRKLYETARGTLLYGLLYYPLLTIGTEQIFRVMEAAASNKCAALTTPPNVRRFAEKVDWLLNATVITHAQHYRWHVMRELRNSTSHPRDQNIFDPNIALEILRSAVELVDGLFV